MDAGTYVAVFVEVAVEEITGHVQVKRAVCYQDMGMGSALSEEIEFKGSKMQTRNFDTYDITRFSWTPEMDAVFDATGARNYRLPMTQERILAAIREIKQ